MNKKQKAKAKTALKNAIDVAGNQTKLAFKLGISPQAVQLWVDSGVVPVQRCKAIEDATKISRASLRPDLFE